MPSIIIIFMNEKYILSQGMLYQYFIIQESSRVYSINYQTSINPSLDFMLVLWFLSNTQVFPRDCYL